MTSAMTSALTMRIAHSIDDPLGRAATPDGAAVGRGGSPTRSRPAPRRGRPAAPSASPSPPGRRRIGGVDGRVLEVGHGRGDSTAHHPPTRSSGRGIGPAGGAAAVGPVAAAPPVPAPAGRAQPQQQPLQEGELADGQHHPQVPSGSLVDLLVRGSSRRPRRPSGSSSSVTRGSSGRGGRRTPPTTASSVRRIVVLAGRAHRPDAVDPEQALVRARVAVGVDVPVAERVEDGVRIDRAGSSARPDRTSSSRSRPARASAAAVRSASRWRARPPRPPGPRPRPSAAVELVERGRERPVARPSPGPRAAPGRRRAARDPPRPTSRSGRVEVLGEPDPDVRRRRSRRRSAGRACTAAARTSGGSSRSRSSSRSSTPKRAASSSSDAPGWSAIHGTQREHPAQARPRQRARAHDAGSARGHRLEPVRRRRRAARGGAEHLGVRRGGRARTSGRPRRW